jgi:hypothetical protein
VTSKRFESVGFGEFRPLVLIGLSVALLGRRLLAGAVYALLMCHTKRLSDPIPAHVASNAAIIGWAIVTQQSLL